MVVAVEAASAAPRPRRLVAEPRRGLITRCRVSCESRAPSAWLSTSDTVVCETLASLATSVMVGRRGCGLRGRKGLRACVAFPPPFGRGVAIRISSPNVLQILLADQHYENCTRMSNSFACPLTSFSGLLSSPMGFEREAARPAPRRTPRHLNQTAATPSRRANAGAPEGGSGHAHYTQTRVDRDAGRGGLGDLAGVRQVPKLKKKESTRSASRRWRATIPGGWRRPPV